MEGGNRGIVQKTHNPIVTNVAQISTIEKIAVDDGSKKSGVTEI